MKKEITLNIKVKIPIGDWGGMLTCDDSESAPLEGYGYDVQRAIMKKFGWTKEIGEQLFKQADEEITKEAVDKDADLGDKIYYRWVELAQNWAMEQMGLQPLPICDRCNKPIEGKYVSDNDYGYGKLHKKCLEEWKEHKKMVEKIYDTIKNSKL